MGKVIVLISITPDGFADAGNVIIDPEFFEFTHTLMDTADVAVFGRQTFELFQDRWPQRLLDEHSPDWVLKMARALNDISKVVFSSTLTSTNWHNSAIIKQLDIDYIKSFKQNTNGNLLTFGSLRIIAALTDMNVVDDYYFNILPLLPGKGDARLFDNGLNNNIQLKYIDSKALASGALVVHYKNENSTS